ncbi:MAG: hypothetical protein Q7U53_06360 [Anaerolineaceae bacterium]|nr:hypothetical protein [Anaerolineaceae bacterium]
MIKQLMNLSENKNIFIILFLIVFLPFVILLLSGKVIFWGTTILQFIPWNQFFFDSILNGVFPLWNPYNGMGVPFVANLQSAVFYPLNWIMLPFYLLGGIKGLAIGLTLLLPTHLFISGFGMIKVLRHLDRSKYAQILSAIVFVFSGYILTRLSFISMVWTFAWLPWILFVCMKLLPITNKNSYKEIINLSILIALQVLAGHAQTTYYTLLLGGIIVLAVNFDSIKQRMLKFLTFVVSVGISLLISAIQVIPTAEFLLNSQRSSEVGYDFAANLSLWPARLLTVLFANFWGNPNYGRFSSGGNFWEENIYIGVFPITILIILFWVFIRKNRRAQISKKNRLVIVIFFSMAIFSILFAFGRFFPLFPFLYQFIPTFSLFQAPSRFLIVYVFSMCILLGFGIDIWLSSHFNHKKTNIYLVVFGTLLVITQVGKFTNSSFPISLINSLLTGSILGFSFGLITLLKDKISKNQFGIKILVAFVVVGDLMFHNFLWEDFQIVTALSEINHSHTSDEFSRIFMSDQDESFLKFSLFFRPDRLQPLVDYHLLNSMVLPNSNLLNNRFSMVNNFDPLQPEKFTQFWNWINKLSNEEQDIIKSMIGVEKIIQIEPLMINSVNVKELKAAEIVQWYGCSKSIKDTNIFEWLLYYETKEQRNRCILLSEEVPNNLLIPKETDQIPEVDYYFSDTNTIIVNYSSVNPGWLVIRQNWYPGWKAIFDGESEIIIKKVDYFFQGLEIPAGDHKVVIKYSPKSFSLGLLISILSIAFIFIFFLYYSICRKSKQ